MSGSPYASTEPETDSTHEAGQDEVTVPEFTNGNRLPNFPNDDETETSPLQPASTSKSRRKATQPKKSSLNLIPFPMSRVKRLIKSEGDTRVSLEASYLIAKAVGLFLDQFVQDAFEHVVADNRNSLSYKDLAAHVGQSRRFEFLADFVPEKVMASDALSRRAQEEM
eukprot:c21442_g1_i1 orf=323-823(-)